MIYAKLRGIGLGWVWLTYFFFYLFYLLLCQSIRYRRPDTDNNYLCCDRSICLAYPLSTVN